MILQVYIALLSIARFENSRQFANAVMHPESQEAISYRRVQSQRIEALEKTEFLVKKARRDAEDTANAKYNANVNARGQHTEISYDIGEVSDNAKMSFRRRLVDILVYVAYI
jgi:hypothetical protein